MKAKINLIGNRIFLCDGKIYFSIIPILRKRKIFIKKKKSLLKAIS